MPHKNARYVLDPGRTPIGSRMVTFDDQPTENDLGIAIGYPLPGSSCTEVKRTTDGVTVAPQSIPTGLVAAWMYFVLTAILVLTICKLPFDQLNVPLFVCGFGACVIIPTTIAVLAACNRSIGNEPYLVFDTATSEVSLPRLNVSFDSNQIQKFVSVDRFVDRVQLWQIAVLVKRDHDWLYAHVCNEASRSSRLENWKFKTLTGMIAEKLNAPFVALSFNRKQSETIDAEQNSYGEQGSLASSAAGKEIH